MTVLGVEIRPHPSFILLGALAAGSVAPGVHASLTRPETLGVVAGSPPAAAVVIILAVVLGILLLTSVLLHELAHAVVARRLGLQVARIDLTWLGGATSLEEPTTARIQYLVSVVGPLANALLGGLSAAVWSASAEHTVPHELAFRLAWVNALLAVYNLLPGLPLDGGQVLRALVWELTDDKITGLRVAGYGGLITAAATAALGWEELRNGQGFALVTVFVAVFVASQAQRAIRGSAAARRLPSAVAGLLARPAYLAAVDLPLAEALRRAAVAGHRAVVLGDAGLPIAVLSESLLSRVPESRRPWVALSSVARAVRPNCYLDAALTGEALLDALRRDPSPEYVVMDGTRLVGVLVTADLTRQLSGSPARA